MNSHFVSKVVLKNFADSNKKIKVFDKNTGKFYLESIEYIGNLELSDDLFSEEEKKWNRTIENRIGNLLSKFDGDFLKIWEDQSSHPVLKRLLALHFIRSFFFITKIQDNLEEKVEELLVNVPPEFHEAVAKEFIHNVAESTPKMMEDLYKKTKSELDKHEIEIVEASKKENFVIGDAPILNDRKAVLDSEFFMMPVSPRYVIGMGKEKRSWHLSTKDTRKVKRKVKRDSLNYWMCMPE